MLAIFLSAAFIYKAKQYLDKHYSKPHVEVYDTEYDILKDLGEIE